MESENFQCTTRQASLQTHVKMSLGEFEVPTFENSVIRLDQPSQYLIRKARFRNDGYESLKKSMKSCTLYIGKLSTDTTEEQLYELFSKCGIIKQIIMGLDRFKNTPCGFCFIVYQDTKGALSAMKYLNHTMLDGSKIEIDLDPGFVEGRQFGRGVDGGQFKKESQPRNGRGGFRGGRGRFQNDGFRRGGFHDRRSDPQMRSGRFDHSSRPEAPRRILAPRTGTLPPSGPRLLQLQQLPLQPQHQQQEQPPLEKKDEELPPHMMQDDDEPMLDIDNEELPPHLR